MTGINAVYNHVSKGNHANQAYAIDWGPNIRATVIPAIISDYRVSLSFNIGSHSRKGRYFLKLKFM